MARFKHLSLSDRIAIQSMLSSRLSLAAIARHLGRDHRTITREVLNYRTFLFLGALGRASNNCAKLHGCRRKSLCSRCVKTRVLCALCDKCNEVCPDFEPAHCPQIERPPFCCNGCHKSRNCSLKRFRYDAEKAHDKARQRLRDVRSGVSLSQAQLDRTDQIVSPLIRKGQSIHHIYFSHKDELFCSEKTLYSLIDSGLLSARNLDLPRKTRRKPPHLKRAFKVDRSCRKDRTFEDYLAFLAEHPDLVATQMDSVVPSLEGHKVLLTLFWPQAQFLLAFLRDHNTARSVSEAFDHLDDLLGRPAFERLFPLLLTDNGSEFSNPDALELQGRTRVFYCDPLHSNQKSPIERAHEFIRAVLPKGSSFDSLSQDDCRLLCSHVNSYRRQSLQGKSPFEVFAFLYGDHILARLGLTHISADEVTLTPRLLEQPH